MDRDWYIYRQRLVHISKSTNMEREMRMLIDSIEIGLRREAEV